MSLLYFGEGANKREHPYPPISPDDYPHVCVDILLLFSTGLHIKEGHCLPNSCSSCSRPSTTLVCFSADSLYQDDCSHVFIFPLLLLTLFGCGSTSSNPPPAAIHYARGAFYTRGNFITRCHLTAIYPTEAGRSGRPKATGDGPGSNR